MNERVSVIIPTFNRFKYVFNAINSVKNQTYKNIEIIVVNDGSAQKQYYEYDWKGNNIEIIHLEKNSKEVFGFSVPGGYQRNFGIKKATGKYIAFLDDDDVWMPQKIELQLKKMKETGCKVSCTEGFAGEGVYNSNKKYKLFHREHFWKSLNNIFKRKNKLHLLNKYYNSEIWTEEFLLVHNCTIGGSSIMLEKEIINKVGFFEVAPTADDYNYWKRLIKISNFAFVNKPLVYIDHLHGDGINYIWVD